jgi:hypothetical protein
MHYRITKNTSEYATGEKVCIVTHRILRDLDLENTIR